MKPTAPQAASVAALWSSYLETLGETPETTDRVFSAWHFCDTKESADGLVELVLQGVKRATAGSVAEYEAGTESMPFEGELSVVTDGDGIARCVIRTHRIDVVPYDKVTAEFAQIEGEGDRSLEYWRRVHWDYFTRALKPLGLEPTPDMPLVCEQFDVVYSPDLVDPVESWNVKAAGWDEQVGEIGDANRRLNSDPVLWKLAGEVQGKHVLDAGCGTGYLSRELARRGARVVGVDFAPAMVEIARKRAHEQGLDIDHFVADGTDLFPSSEFVTASIAGENPNHGQANDVANSQPSQSSSQRMNPSLLPNSFDLAISNYVLMDMPNLQGAIESLARALRPGGIAVLILSHPCFPQGDTTSVDKDPRSPVVTYRWPHNYFEAGAHLEPAWGRFDTAFPSFHRPLSDYFQAFTSAGFTVTALEEPRLTPDRFHLTEDDERRKRRSQLLPYSIAFRLLRK